MSIKLSIRKLANKGLEQTPNKPWFFDKAGAARNSVEALISLDVGQLIEKEAENGAMEIL